VIHLLSPEGLRALDAFVRPDMLVAFDYDGTLAAITSDPLRAHMRPATGELLARVARRYRTLVLTGRSRGDAARLLGDIAGVEIVGNHGAETADSTDDGRGDQVAAWKLSLQSALGSLPGVVIEDKARSLSVHYRHAPDAAVALAAIEHAAADLPGAHLVGGKCVVNIVAEDAPNKGTALLAAMERIGAPRALFAGDDTTDEHVFELDRPETLLSVRVGAAEHSRARFFLRDQDEIDVLLRRLADAP
jgi:trehalose 6-phosphate phosphatase